MLLEWALFGTECALFRNMAGPPPIGPPLLQLPPLQIPPQQQQQGPGQPHGRAMVMRVVQLHGQQNQLPVATVNRARDGRLMEAANFKVLADMQGRSACVSLLRPNGPWTELPDEFVESVLHATQRLPVHELILKCHQLKTLPRNTSQLNSVCVLDLSFNKLESVPDVLSELHHLHQLHLQHNHIASVPTSLGQHLGSLRVLNLQHNKLSALPAGVCSCISLEILNVEGNKIHNFSEDVEKLVTLKQLHASCNALEFLPAALCKLGNLEELYLSSNSIQHISDISGMRSLKQLHLANNKLQFLPPCIASMQHLQGLTLTGNPMRFPPLRACRGGVKCMQQFMLTKMENSVVDDGLGDGHIDNIYYTGSDYELETGNESPFENID